MGQDDTPRVVTCRKCGNPIFPGRTAFGSPSTGWEHMAGECTIRLGNNVEIAPGVLWPDHGMVTIEPDEP